MSDQDKRTPQPDPPRSGYTSPFDVRKRWGHERRDKIAQEIMANRRGEYRVPTWVLSVCLVLMIAAVVAFIMLV
jgi:hypothetical protein